MIREVWMDPDGLKKWDSQTKQFRNSMTRHVILFQSSLRTAEQLFGPYCAEQRVQWKVVSSQACRDQQRPPCDARDHGLPRRGEGIRCALSLWSIFAFDGGGL